MSRPHVDTSVLVKLYVSEPDSADAIERVRAHARPPVPFNPLHELEMTSAIGLKVFRGEMTPAQAARAAAALASDLRTGVLGRRDIDTAAAFRRACALAREHAAALGCRSLDALHVGIALEDGFDLLISNDSRQRDLAAACGLRVLA